MENVKKRRHKQHECRKGDMKPILVTPRDVEEGSKVVSRSRIEQTS
jgi:hypothetical protein